ncbi:hypothetical protein [Gluconobacter oxydans]|uniref:hypothetical protein n=1 Tax=Gluconobacter oxydans TaxID=442 RepID=UPI0039E99122
MPFFAQLQEDEMKRSFARHMHCGLDEWIENLVKEGKQSEAEARKNAWRLAKNFERKDSEEEMQRGAEVAEHYNRIVDSQKFLK